MTGIEKNIEQLNRRIYKKRNTSVVIDENDIALLQGLSDGKGLPQIGAKMGLSKWAVSARCRRLFERLSVHNAAHAVAWAYKNGLLE